MEILILIISVEGGKVSGRHLYKRWLKRKRKGNKLAMKENELRICRKTDKDHLELNHAKCTN